jgi:hypothetical protein
MSQVHSKKKNSEET